MAQLCIYEETSSAPHLPETQPPATHREGSLAPPNDASLAQDPTQGRRGQGQRGACSYDRLVQQAGRRERAGIQNWVA